MSLLWACLLQHGLVSDKQKRADIVHGMTLPHPNKRDFCFVFVWSHLVLQQTNGGIPNESESSPSPEQMEFCGNFLSKWNFTGILSGRLLARIAKYSLNGSLHKVKFHRYVLSTYVVDQEYQYHICVLMLSLFRQVGWFEWALLPCKYFWQGRQPSQKPT